MPYLTQTDITNYLVAKGTEDNYSLILQDLIDDHLSSSALEDMQKADAYYSCRHDIEDKDFRTYYIRSETHTDLNAANNKIAHPFFKLLIDQKTAYVVGNPITFGSKTENDNMIDDLNKILDEDFELILPSWITRASKHGYELLHVYVNENGELDYVVIDAQNCIIVYDSQYEKELIYVIRFYTVTEVNASGTEQTLYKVEWWDKKQVTFFSQNTENGNFYLDPEYEINPRGHFKKGQYLNGELIEGTLQWLSWGKVPFCILENNDDKTNDLKSIKKIIDNYDIMVSQFANKLEDLADAIWQLVGYPGTDLAEFRQNLKTFKAISLQEGGNATPITMQIPHEAHNAHLDKLEDNIYIFGQSVDPRKDKFGNSPSGVALRYMYILLDLKANVLIRKLKKALRDLMFFVTEYLKITEGKQYDPNDATFTCNKSILINEFETVQMLQLSKGMISDETVLENHPRVEDVSQEKKRLEAQKENEPKLDLDKEPIENEEENEAK